MKKIFTLLFVLQLLCSCGHENDCEFTHIPFKAKDSDRWGLIGTDGKILFEDKFSNKPSVVINGIFYVKNENELYEYYYAKEKPERINDKVYSGVTPFLEDIAPVTEPGQHISFIHKDGSHAFVFDSYEGQEIISISRFFDGLAAFETRYHKYGYINAEGKVVISPKFTDAQDFSEGLAVVWENGRRPAYLVIESKSIAYVINKKGEKQFDLDVKPDDRYNYVWFGSFTNGLLPCGECDVSHLTGIKYYLNKQGEKIFDHIENIDENSQCLRANIYIHSDYVKDIKKDIDKLFDNFQKNKIEEIYLGMSLEELRKVRDISYVKDEYYDGDRIYDLLSGIDFENIRVEYTLFFDQHISKNDAKIKRIAIHVFLKEPIEGEYFDEGENVETNKRIETVVKNTITNKLNYEYKFDKYEYSSTFQIYQKNGSKYPIGLLKSGTADWVDIDGYEILIINSINELK